MQILLIGLLFVIAGIAAILEVIMSLLQQRISINIGVFCLFIGIGILRGRESSRRWGRFFAALFLTLLLLLGGMVVCGIPGLSISIAGFETAGYDQKRGIAAVVIAALMALPLWIYWALSAERYRDNPYIHKRV